MICWVVAVLYDAAIPSNNINNRVYVLVPHPVHRMSRKR